MRRLQAVALGALVLGLACADAMAQCPLSGGGGMGGYTPRTGPGVRGGGCPLTGGGGIGACGGGSGKRAQAKANNDAFQKWALPSAAPVASLDTSKFDAAAASLELSQEQSGKIADLKAQIKAEATRLAQAQADARAAYEKTQGQEACTGAYQKVLAAAGACRAFDANRKFAQAVANVLTADQRKRLAEPAGKVKTSPEKAEAAG